MNNKKRYFVLHKKIKPDIASDNKKNVHGSGGVWVEYNKASGDRGVTLTYFCLDESTKTFKIYKNNRHVPDEVLQSLGWDRLFF